MAAYGVYMAMQPAKKESGCGCKDKPAAPDPVISNNVDGGVNTTEIFPDVVKESFDYRWHTLYPTPDWKDIEDVPQSFVTAQ